MFLPVWVYDVAFLALSGWKGLLWSYQPNEKWKNNDYCLFGSSIGQQPTSPRNYDNVFTRSHFLVEYFSRSKIHRKRSVSFNECRLTWESKQAFYKKNIGSIDQKRKQTTSM